MVTYDSVACNFDVGDLVRLKEDDLIEVGYGIIIEVKFNFDDIYDVTDIENLDNRIRILRSKSARRNDDFYPTKPQILVMWNGLNTGRSVLLWMYYTEILLIQKSIK